MECCVIMERSLPDEGALQLYEGCQQNPLSKRKLEF